MDRFKFNVVYEQLMQSVAPTPEPPPDDSSNLSVREVKDMVIHLRKILYESNRFFWYVLKDMPMKIVDPNHQQIRTMAVDKYRNLYINPRFATEILEGFLDENGRITTTQNPFTFVIAHEVYHIVNRTFERQHDRNVVLDTGSQKVTLWNIATDFEMNDQLQWKWGLVPPKGGLLTDEKGDAEFFGHKIKVRNRSAERIYADILKMLPPPPPGSGKGEGEGEGEGEGGEGEGEGEGKGEGKLSTGDSKEQKIVKVDPNKLGTMPTDEMIDGDNAPDTLEGSDDSNNKDTILEEPDKIVKRAEKELEKQKGTRGEGGKNATIDTFDIDKRNYRDILREVIGTPINTGQRSYSRPVRRYATQRFQRPGKVSEPDLGNVILALDTSGSITRAMISKFIGSAQKIAEVYKNRNLKLRIVLYIERVYKYVDFNPAQVQGSKLAEWLMKNIDTSGGNYFPQVMKDMQKMKDLNTFKGIIYLTDGFEVYDPGFELPAMKNIFLISGPVGEGYGNTEFLKYISKKKPAGKNVDIYQVNLNQ